MIIRTLIVIPTYNNKDTIEAVTQSIRDLYSEHILIIDDGSDINVRELIPISILDVTILTNSTNQGKGFSIQRAFRYALKHSYTNIITIDADGQHKAKDIRSFYDQIQTSPFSLIIGKRKFNVENIPSSSKFGRKFSNFWVKYQTDKVIEDSQSGFRCYPLFHIQNMKFFTKKYDFEIEILVRLLWKKVDVKEIDTDVYYPPADQRVSHFDKLWDNVKISILNTVFVILSLLRSNLSGPKKASSIAVGVFFAVQPIYGFQVFFLALFSFLFKLNFSLMFASSQISIPPMIPLWTFLSLKIGSIITQTPMLISFNDINIELAKASLFSWIIGSFILGLILAAIVFIIYFVSFLIKPREKKSWDGQDRGGRFGNMFMEKVISILGQRIAYFVLYFICPYFYIFALKATKAQNEYFKLLYPKQGFFLRQFKIIKVFLLLGRTMIDNKLVKHTSIDYFKVNRTGHKNLEPTNTGHIIIGAHTGGWLLAAKLFPDDLISTTKRRKINIVEFAAQKNQSSNKKISSAHINFISSNDKNAIFKINQALDSNETVVFMADRVISKTSEQIKFLNRLTFFDKTPFKIAQIKNVPISFAFAFKKSKREYDLFITDKSYYDTDSSENKDIQIIQKMNLFTSELESKLRLYPYQWFNFFKFWTIIPEPLSSLGDKNKDIKLS